MVVGLILKAILPVLLRFLGELSVRRALPAAILGAAAVVVHTMGEGAAQCPRADRFAGPSFSYRPTLARRARIILAYAEGSANKVVAKRLRMSQTTVCKWRGRFARSPKWVA